MMEDLFGSFFNNASTREDSVTSDDGIPRYPSRSYLEYRGAHDDDDEEEEEDFAHIDNSDADRNSKAASVLRNVCSNFNLLQLSESSTPKAARRASSPRNVLLRSAEKAANKGKGRMGKLRKGLVSTATQTELVSTMTQTESGVLCGEYSAVKQEIGLALVEQRNGGGRTSFTPVHTPSGGPSTTIPQVQILRKGKSKPIPHVQTLQKGRSKPISEVQILPKGRYRTNPPAHMLQKGQIRRIPTVQTLSNVPSTSIPPVQTRKKGHTTSTLSAQTRNKVSATSVPPVKTCIKGPATCIPPAQTFNKAPTTHYIPPVQDANISQPPGKPVVVVKRISNDTLRYFLNNGCRMLKDSDMNKYQLKNNDLEPAIARKTRTEKPCNEIYACDLCDYKTTSKNLSDYKSSTKKLLRLHYYYVHFRKSPCMKSKRAHATQKPRSVEVHRCGKCDYTSKFSVNLARHVENMHTNIRRFPCALCDHAAKERHHLLYHMQSCHNTDKPFRCDRCSFTAKLKASLAQHVKHIHEAEEVTKYACTKCAHTTIYKSDLACHMKNMHEPAAERSFACDLCGHRSKSLNHLKSHHSHHHDAANPFHCPHCRYSGKNHRAFAYHMTKVHPEQRPKRVKPKYFCEPLTR